MIIRKSGLRVVLLGLLVGCGSDPGPEVPGATGDEAAAVLVATWDGGQLTQFDYQDWLAAQGIEPDDEYAARLAVLSSLAEAATRRGADREIGVRLAAEAARHRILLPMLDEVLDAEVEISDEDIEDLRLERPEAFVRPRRIRMSGLFKRWPQAESERVAVAGQVQQWRDEVAAGRDLGPLARAESDSQNRFREGSVGWVEPAELPEAVRDAVEALAVGEVSAVLEHGGGLAFYRIDEIRERIEPTIEEVRFKLRQNLFRQRRAELGEALNRSLVDAVTVDPGGDPVVQVGDYRLPQAAVDALAALRIPERDPASLNRAQRLRLVREWAQRVALADEAERRGLHLEPEAAAALRWVLPNVLAADELRYRVDARLVAPTEPDLRALFASQGSRLREPEHLRVALIQFSNEREPTLEQLAEARRVVGAVQSGELDFEQAARAHSMHPTAAGGGLLPWATRSELGGIDVRLLAPLRMLEPGGDTGLIRSDAGLWFARLVDRRPSRPLGFEEARERLVAIDRRQQIQRLEREIQDEQRARIRLVPAASLPSADDRP